jgi:prophage regulatory protein
MIRTKQYADQALTTTGTTNPAADLNAHREATASDRSRNAREAVRGRQPLRAFDARALRELSPAAPTDQAVVRRTIRRKELRQIVPLADSTVYELERRGGFPQRFFLTARCVVWDLAEVEAWVWSRRQPGGSDAVKKAPIPDFRKRLPRVAMDNG